MIKKKEKNLEEIGMQDKSKGSDFMLNSEWEVGAEVQGKGIYIRLKGEIDRKYSHSFLSIEDAEKLAKHIKLATCRLREASIGTCCLCNEIITNNDKYYELNNKKMIHKYCIGNYLENNVITEKLIPKVANGFDTRQIYYENKI